jgi:proteasome lid subunit RPN8/RPN11
LKIASARKNPSEGTLGKTILIEKGLAGKLFRVCTEALPAKAYGLVGGKDLHHPESIYPCSTNLRNTPEWKSVFESFGDFYKHPDRGFVVSQEECRQILKKMETSGESFVGVYHSHRYTHPVPSKVDMALHVNPILFCYIVSVVNPAMPELKIYRLGKNTYQEIPFEMGV